MVTLVGGVLIGLVVVAAVGYGSRGNLYRLRWEKPLREAIRARPVAFQAQVELQNERGPVSLTMHGDAFEIVQRFPVIGFLNGTDYCYEAAETTLETAHGWVHDWIEIRALPGTGSGAEPIRIGRRKMNRQLWDVLVGAGAHPIGPPPER